MKPHAEILQRKGYSIQASLGRGGQYYAYRAMQTGRGECAVRVFKELLENTEELPRQIRDELHTASELRSSLYFSTLFDWFVEDGWLFTVWDFAEHGSLRDVIEKGTPLSRDKVVEYLKPVAKGLDQLHAVPGVHGDIKPENLLIYSGEHVKIGDLGIARLFTSATIRKTSMGSDDYLLPNKHSGAPTRERDLFGFAVTYAELRLGRHPYGDEPYTRLQNLIANAPDLDELEFDEQKMLRPMLMQEDGIDWESPLAEWLKLISHCRREQKQASTSSNALKVNHVHANTRSLNYPALLLAIYWGFAAFFYFELNGDSLIGSEVFVRFLQDYFWLY